MSADAAGAVLRDNTDDKLTEMSLEMANAQAGQRALHAVHKPRAVLDQALALPIRSDPARAPTGLHP